MSVEVNDGAAAIERHPGPDSWHDTFVSIDLPIARSPRCAWPFRDL